MTAYTIQINEYQRRLLLVMLKAETRLDISTLLNDVGNPDIFPDSPVEELTLFIQNLEGLPEMEEYMIKKHKCAPGEAVHGFCL